MLNKIKRLTQSALLKDSLIYVVGEMTAKAGQKCTAIRRIIVPEAQVEAVSQALIARLENVVVGDPAQEGVKMGLFQGYRRHRKVRRPIAHPAMRQRPRPRWRNATGFFQSVQE